MRLSLARVRIRWPIPSARPYVAGLCQPVVMSAPPFDVRERPGDIVDRSGRWLAEQLGWRWLKSRRDVEVRAGRQVRRLGLQSSTWNRAGVATWVSTRVMVLDADLTAWRHAHPASFAWSAPDAVPPHAYNTLLINVERDLAEIECSGLPQRIPAPRAMGPAEFAAAFQERVIPVLDLFQSPSRVARELPVWWLGMVTYGTIEWALACGDQDAAALLLRRHLERPLRGSQQWEQRFESFRRGWEAAPGRDGLPGPGMDVYSTESLGWLARVHDLDDPETFAEPAPNIPVD